jgi:hypothetical protein
MKALKLAAIFALFAVPLAAEEFGGVANPGTSQEISELSAADRQQLRRNLRVAGFEHVEIEAVAYLVRARSGDGRQIVIHIDPPTGADALSMAEVEDVTVTGSIRSGH